MIQEFPKKLFNYTVQRDRKKLTALYQRAQRVIQRLSQLHQGRYQQRTKQFMNQQAQIAFQQLSQRLQQQIKQCMEIRLLRMGQTMVGPILIK